MLQCCILNVSKKTNGNVFHRKTESNTTIMTTH